MEIDHDHENPLSQGYGAAGEQENPPPPRSGVTGEQKATGVAVPGVIDLLGFDCQEERILLVMNEQRPWDGSDERLFQLQEKFNAYASFILDGELGESHPEYLGKPARIELRCAHMPDERALGLLELIHNQLALQEIKVDVLVREETGCGDGCSCHS